MVFRPLFRRRGVFSLLRTIRWYIFGKRGQRFLSSLRAWYRLRIETVLWAKKPIAHMARSADVRVWFNGTEAFPRLFRLLHRARHTVHIHLYNWNEDAVGTALARTLVKIADRGVKVSIAKDATGDMWEFDQDFLSSQDSANTVWMDFWNHPRIQVKFVENEDHSKVFIIDDDVLLIGSLNVSDGYRESWDHLVELRGRHFVRDYLTSSVSESTEAVQLLLSKQIRPKLEELIEGAQSSIVVQHCYIGDAKLLALLGKATYRGVHVKLYIPKRADVCHHLNLASVDRLMSLSKRGFLSVRTLPGFMHGKMILVDRKFACLGSLNFITRSLNTMYETNVYISQRSRTVRKIRRFIRRMQLSSKPLNASSWGVFSKIFALLGL